MFRIKIKNTAKGKNIKVAAQMVPTWLTAFSPSWYRKYNPTAETKRHKSFRHFYNGEFRD